MFEYAHPTRVICGAGALARLGEIVRELGLQNVLVVSDPDIVACGHAPRAVDVIREAGVRAELFDGVRENPSTETVDACLAVAKHQGVDGFVGLGGGSSMDTAKGANLLLTNGGAFSDYIGEGKLKRPGLPTVTVPTTAGTGSEVQSSVLITDPATHRKMICRDPRLAPRVALLDPDLTRTQPAHVAAATGIDALAHAIESYVTTRRTPVSRMFAREAWVRVARSVERALAEAPASDALADMQLGACFGGASIENSMLGAAHAAANPLTAAYGITHGIAVGVMLPHVMRFNAAAVGDHYAELARAAGLWSNETVGRDGAAEALTARVAELIAGAPACTRLVELGADARDFPALAEEAAAQWTARCNPRAVAAEDFVRLYEQALDD